jgi:sigma-B regulation protein RsbU (phosphoserine phosphatase)
MNKSSSQTKIPTWMQVIKFGEKLNDLVSTEAKCELTISTIQEWFDCAANIWLISPESSNLISGGNWQDLLGVDHKTASLIEKALSTDKITTYQINGTKPLLMAPLSTNGTFLGFIKIERDYNKNFLKKEIALLDGFRTQVALAIQASQNDHAIQCQLHQLSSILDVSKAISANLSLDDLLTKIAENIHQIINIPYVFVYTVHPGRRKIFLKTGAGSKLLPFQNEEIQFDLDDPTNLIPHAARTSKSILRTINVGESFPLLSDEMLTSLQSELILPIVLDDKVLAILDLLSDKANAFSIIEQSILKELTNSIAIAIRNATLYRSEQWRRKVADSVREVTGLLTADVELEQVLNRILSELEHTLPCDFAAIWLLEEINPLASDEKKNYLLNLAAVHTSWQLENLEDDKSQLSSSELIQLLRGSNVESTWLLDALKSDKPIVRTPASPFEPIGSILDFPENYSSIAAPLRIADRQLGILSLGHHTTGRYGYESQTISETFASYAAVAIENTRLYEAAHDQAWISTVLLQVAEATQSLNSMDELLATMARITPMLIGVNACIIFLYEKPLEAFLPVSAYGIEQDDHNKFDNKIFYVEECPTLKRILQTKAPVWLNQDSHINPGDIKLISYFLEENNSAALIPMIVHGDIRGAFLVDFSNEDVYRDENEQPDRFEEKFTIIQGIAHQTALAVENLRLLKSQQEEAYVSIALLQVAQAVVSLNELAETLETIVRITPILTGVKRTAIFLWDKDNLVFSLSQSYGISRVDQNVLNKNYIVEEFPLLNFVYSQNKMAYHIYTTETEPPLEWERIPYSEIDLADLNIFPQDDHQESNDDKTDQTSFLSLQASLLLAYPLSVRGEFLGVMVTQEVSTPGVLISAQSRSRRQEITIGITQQAALAIQNDRLQNEVVERERMERELQLAREIQQTFLPDHLPSKEGWELAVLWKPAREVGGDFYDVFELPGNRLGLVIADVADKGMPAALFMTLVRTLIRATAREELSPSAVLEIVNDLLVTDTKHGLFITVAYAVLSLETGKVIFANAGHNYPMLIRHEPKQIEILETTGMAIGVLKGIHIADLSKSLNPDDCLVFYTDGITEAFSPEGEMYGENRLRETVLSAECIGAQQHLIIIEQSVQEFIDGLPPSDDITLLTICRTRI